MVPATEFLGSYYFWGLLQLLNINSKSGEIFTPEKEFFKLVVGLIK